MLPALLTLLFHVEKRWTTGTKVPNWSLFERENFYFCNFPEWLKGEESNIIYWLYIFMLIRGRSLCCSNWNKRLQHCWKNYLKLMKKYKSCFKHITSALIAVKALMSCLRAVTSLSYGRFKLSLNSSVGRNSQTQQVFKVGRFVYPFDLTSFVVSRKVGPVSYIFTSIDCAIEDFLSRFFLFSLVNCELFAVVAMCLS